MDLAEYRAQPRERERVESLLRLLPTSTGTVLDVGARDGHLSRLLADRGMHVTALDLQRPSIADRRIACLAGDLTRLELADRSFQAVLCAEVLEHIPEPGLSAACANLQRVADRSIVIGVPYRQDIRVGRLSCRSCGGISPPWGHVNSFDEARLHALFPQFRAVQTEFVGERGPGTNALAAMLMDWAGNPWASYTQEEPCIHCGRPFASPPPPTLAARVLCRASVLARSFARPTRHPGGNWIHVLFERR